MHLLEPVYAMYGSQEGGSGKRRTQSDRKANSRKLQKKLDSKSGKTATMRRAGSGSGRGRVRFGNVKRAATVRDVETGPPLG